mgnify:FL=1|jgi:hypothetical protein
MPRPRERRSQPAPATHSILADQRDCPKLLKSTPIAPGGTTPSRRPKVFSSSDSDGPHSPAGRFLEELQFFQTPAAAGKSRIRCAPDGRSPVSSNYGDKGRRSRDDPNRATRGPGTGQADTPGQRPERDRTGPGEPNSPSHPKDQKGRYKPYDAIRNRGWSNRRKIWTEEPDPPQPKAHSTGGPQRTCRSGPPPDHHH